MTNLDPDAAAAKIQVSKSILAFPCVELYISEQAEQAALLVHRQRIEDTVKEGSMLKSRQVGTTAAATAAALVLFSSPQGIQLLPMRSGCHSQDPSSSQAMAPQTTGWQ
jgi:hypothetical protein